MSLLDLLSLKVDDLTDVIGRMNEVEMYLRSFSLALKNEDLLNLKAKAFHMFVLVVMIMILSGVLSAKKIFESSP